MKPLYEIAKEFLHLFKVDDQHVVNGETGEVLDASYLDQLQMDMETKVDNICCLIKDLEADMENCKEQEASFAARRKADESKIKSLKAYLTHWIAGKNITTKRAQVRWRKSTSVVISDEAQVPDKYKSQVVTVKINKTALKKDLKNAPVPGAVIVENENIQIA